MKIYEVTVSDATTTVHLVIDASNAHTAIGRAVEGAKRVHHLNVEDFCQARSKVLFDHMTWNEFSGDALGEESLFSQWKRGALKR